MADVTERVKGQASKPDGLRAPGASGGVLEGPKAVLDNRWGSSLAKGGKSLSLGGRGKK